MAKKKKKKEEVSIEDMFREIADQSNGDLLGDLEETKFFIDTGNLAVNYICSGRFVGGGIPGNRITEVFGPEASGKSLFAANVMSAAQKGEIWTVLLDCENASNADFMERISGVDSSRVLRYTPPTLEKSFQQIHVTTKNIRDLEEARGMEKKPIFFVFDSLTVPPCERELRENDLPMDYSAADWKKVVGRQEQPGERAKIISREMRKLQSMVVENDVTVYIVNQIRDKIGVLYGSPETTPGGKAMQFYSSLRLRTASKKKIENKALGKFAGINLQVKNIKNRSFRPHCVANDVKLYFEDGIDCMSGIFLCLFEDERVVANGAQGNYKVASKYLADPENDYKFKAKKTDNTMPMEVIMDNPKLVDVETREEVEAYIQKWNSGFSATVSGDYEEQDFTYDAEGNLIKT